MLTKKEIKALRKINGETFFERLKKVNWGCLIMIALCVIFWIGVINLICG